MEGGSTSVLESVGAEILGIVVPVSVCMLLVVLLVHSLTPHGADVSVQSVATLVYREKPSDSTSQKLEGALLNSLVFVAMITGVTFLLVLLYYCRCIKFLKYYMCASAALVLAYMGGVIFLQLIQTLSIPLDIFTFVILLYNFTVVGVLAVLLTGMPILITQFYLVMIGMLVAFWFTMLPEWTTWVLLVAMALYDLVAVLAPGGPLNLLVELAISRDEEIPALIYEARPITMSEHMSTYSPSAMGDSASVSSVETSSSNHHRPRRWRSRNRHSSTIGAIAPSTELQPWNGNTNGHADNRESVDLERQMPHPVRVSNEDAQENRESRCFPQTGDEHAHHIQDIRDDDESLPLISHRASPPISVTVGSEARGVEGRHHDMDAFGNENEDGIGLSSSGALKLGLGDFVFYSLLVGRAAMYDLTTVYACYLAIISGLGSTLVLLAVARRALPALPISIGLGVIFYFLTRLLMEPLVAGLSTTLVMF